MNHIMTYFFIFFITITSGFFFIGSIIIWLLTGLFDKRLVILHMYSSFWSDVYIRLMPAWNITVTGREKLNPDKAYVIISNHQSYLDILAAFKIYFPFKWVSKQAVFNLPFIGWNMYLNKYIGLKRGNRESVINMLEQCEEAIIKGSSIYMFPEGTRSETGKLKPFKPGFASLAKKVNAPVLPIVINGSRDALPKESLIIRGKHNITLTILDEIPPSRFQNMTEGEFTSYTQDIFNQNLINY